MAKQIAEQSKNLSIFWLKKNGYLVPKQFGGGVRSGIISWAWGERKSSISFILATNMEEIAGTEDYIRLQYRQIDQLTGEKEDMDFKIPLTTTSCNYGGVRYWFVCSCGRQVGVMYRVGRYFACRKCGNIAYLAQMEGGKFRISSVTIPGIERAEKDVKRPYYNGKPTRKYRRLIRLSEKLENSLAGWISNKFPNMV